MLPTVKQIWKAVDRADLPPGEHPGVWEGNRLTVSDPRNGQKYLAEMEKTIVGRQSVTLTVVGDRVISVDVGGELETP